MVKKEIIDIVMKYKNSLKDRFVISDLYIFGSYAKSEYTDDSDIDVAVIVENELRYEDEIELMRRRRSIDLRIEPHLFNVSDFHDGNPLTEEIKKTGIKLQ